jgi:phage terminase large subunit
MLIKKEYHYKKTETIFIRDGKRTSNQSTVDVLKQIIQANKLQPGMDQIDVKRMGRT